jgi:cellulose biosynthesis protein BcsQ
MTILAVYSNKGGVGKTAAAVNLSYLAAASGARTLLVDLDPQGAATYYFRVKPKLKRKAQGLASAQGNPALEASIKATDYDRLDLLPADLTHRNLDLTYDRLKRSDRRLAATLRPLRGEYEFIFLDCPPTLSLVAENIFHAAELMLVPIIPTTLSMRSHEQLLKFMKEKRFKSTATFAFLSMVDRLKRLHRELASGIYERFANVLQASVPYHSLVEQMGIHREPLPAYAAASPPAKAYMALWLETSQLISASNR